jgi:hypothetical protein
MLVQHDGQREENALYAAHARFLRTAGVRVPEVFAELPGRRACVMEDLGDVSLQALASGASPSRLLRRYEEVLDTARLLHLRGSRLARASRRRLMPPFTPRLYAWEHSLFLERFVRRLPGMSPAQVEGVARDLRTAARALSRLPRVLLHRDLQSSNVFYPPSGGPAFLDFQGMRFGPVVYDLAALLCDPYVSLSPPVQERLLARCARRYPPEHAVADAFWYAAVQRLTQALGAFGRLAADPATARFRRHIPPALRMMQRALDRIPPLPHLSNLVHRAAERTWDPA